jgi:DNA-directed RNA polymerase beta' subunit
LPTIFEDLFNDPKKEVTSSEIFEDKDKTIYHRNGLFSEQIFGPVKDYECQCGNLKGKINKGKRCPICGVLCDSSILRYKEFGYIKLKLPVLYTLIIDKIIKRFFANKSVFNNMIDMIVLSNRALFFNKRTKKFEEIEEISNFFEKNDLNVADIKLTPKNFAAFLMVNFKDEIDSDRYKEIVETYDLEYPIFGIYSLYRFFKTETFQKVLDEFFNDNPKYEVFRDIIFLHKIPVCPPELRPFVKTETKEIYHEITKKLRTLINVNNLIIFEDHDSEKENEEETISEIYFKDLHAIRLQRNVNDYYKQIEQQIHGKEGKIRQYIHGKVIDFSSRGVITPSIRIKPYEVEIPYHTAREIFSPYFANYIIKKLQELDYNDEDYEIYRALSYKFLAYQHGVITKYAFTDKEHKILDDLFNEFIDKVNSNEDYEFYVIMNRPPTLWIYNFIAFNVKIKKDKNDYTFGVHPLTVSQQNADFDGKVELPSLNPLNCRKPLRAYWYQT